MGVHFSNRTSWDTSESSLSGAIRDRRAAGLEVVDLTVSNPTVCGFAYDSEAILGALSHPAAMIYDPNPLGLPIAREAVAGYYADHGAVVGVGQVVLTTSTSEAYSFLFRLLCDPGDAILVAQPGYPLFDFLADLDDISLQPYPLFEDFGWWIDFAELERRIGPRTRAIVLVHPNNPTGHATTRPERERLQEVCARHGLALIVDEVFLDYGLVGNIKSFAFGVHPCLTFVVNGLSKIAALPQMKVGWIACFGPESAGALARLEVIADTFLSMNAPAQLALPTWLAGRVSIQAQILARVRENLAALTTSHLRPMRVEAGWCAILKLPRFVGSGTLAETLVAEAGVVVHPGGFYGMPQPHYVVLSLLGAPDSFRRGVEALNKWCESKELT
jgi:aspartate/methionine/tyrosine aminotransferase